MPFRSIVATPEELALIVAAFEKAWSEIDARGSFDVLKAAGQRERLGYIVAGLWSAGETIDLAKLAVLRFDETAMADALERQTVIPNKP
ncbi:hypothetical protein AB4Z40_32380 [Bosea sp. 2YAB26]|uniref:hypothetical protein n=1 Tax=Bosea sp. 2YAB26 TaxID=3237478 RepID=UPI003F915D74